MQVIVWRDGWKSETPRTDSMISCTILSRLVNHNFKHQSMLMVNNKVDGIKNMCKPIAMAGHLNWKFGIQAGQDDIPEEVVLRIQGIVCSRGLPPIQRPYEVYVIIINFIE
jgi:hypothetical protein